MRALLVDDDELVRLCLSELLAEAGLQIIEAPNAEQALSFPVAAQMSDVVVSDVNLGPGMDGFAFVAALRQRWPDVRALLISGVASNVIGRQLGPWDRFLPKPFTGTALLRNISDLTGDDIPASCR